MRAPVPGLVIRYSYLWRDEALAGREEGSKDRPAVIVLAVAHTDGQTVVTVAPVTHAPPKRPELAVEIPQATKRRLGLDQEPSWIVTTDLNMFVWPGVDLRPLPTDRTRYDYGLLPATLFRHVRDRIVALAKLGRTSATRRSE